MPEQCRPAGNPKDIFGAQMSVATTVGNVDSQLAWLEINDNDGGVWRYTRGDLAPDASEVHVDYDYQPPRLVARLVRRQDGTAVLRQDEPGLPDKIVVNYIELTAIPGMPMPAGWGGKYEYCK